MSLIALAPDDLPDLLSLAPTLRIDGRAARDAVVFAFAAGEGGAGLERVVSEADTVPSSFDPARFADGLFLEDLVRVAFRVRALGTDYQPNASYLVRTLAQPPRDPACAAFRRTILSELTQKPELRADLERTYAEVRAFLDAIATPVHGSFLEHHQHRVSVLRGLHGVVEALASRFGGARSGLSRLPRYGQRLRKSPAFEELTSLLAYEDGMATVDVRLRIGVDGSVRGFALTETRELRESRFYRGPVGRFLTRVALWLRGYRFGDVEIVARICDQVFSPFEDTVVHLAQLAADMEVLLGCLGMRDLALERGLSVCLPELSREGPREMYGLFNPLLLAGRGTPKPCDLKSARANTTVVVTGPNSGGKTRLMQAIGITQLLAQHGFFVPARSARLSWTEGIFVSLFQEVSADQREGRLGTELVRIRQLFEEVAPGDLALIDELCSGTNPSEAEALIRLVLELFAELQPQVFVTTHFLSFAAELSRNPPTQGMEFLQATIDERSRPTYTFAPGVAETSLAAETAARLGVTLEELVGLVARKRPREAAPPPLPGELGSSESAGDAPEP